MLVAVPYINSAILILLVVYIFFNPINQLSVTVFNVTAEVDAAKSAWDDDNVEGESSAEKIIRLGAKPNDITIP